MLLPIPIIRHHGAVSCTSFTWVLPADGESLQSLFPIPIKVGRHNLMSSPPHCPRQTFWKICQDNRTIRNALKNPEQSLLNSQRVEAVFMTACSIGEICTEQQAMQPAQHVHG